MNFLITGRYKVLNDKPFFYLDVGWDNYFKKIKSNYDLYKPKEKKEYVCKFDCLIISGGGDIYNISKNKHDRYRDKIELNLIKQFLKYDKPIILICRGFQLIAKFFGNDLIKIDKHIRINHKIMISRNMLTKEKIITSNSFHNYGFLKLDNSFKVIGKTLDKSIEIAKIKKKNILCLMFHPERFNKDQKKIDNLLIEFLEKSLCN
tara:strand:+ start:1009 stop:1623 length:615 start_codon:yes stop_codon:yes gene_type:complete